MIDTSQRTTQQIEGIEFESATYLEINTRTPSNNTKISIVTE